MDQGGWMKLLVSIDFNYHLEHFWIKMGDCGSEWRYSISVAAAVTLWEKSLQVSL